MKRQALVFIFTLALFTVKLAGQCVVSVSIISSANPVCEGTSVTFTATPINGGATPSYQWNVNNINVGTNLSVYSYAPVNGDIVKCILTSDAVGCTGSPATSNSLLMTVNPNLPVSVLIAASANPVCANTSVTFTATPANGGTTPVYQWKVNGINAGTDNHNYSYTPVNGDIVTCSLTSNETCTTGNPAVSNTVTMTVNPILPVSVLIAASANPVCPNTSVTFTATPANGGTTPVYQWKVNGINRGTNNNIFSYTPVNGDIVRCVLTSNETCISGSPATSNSITMSVNPDLPVSVLISASANPVCANTAVTFTAVPVNGGTTPAYQWKVNGVNAGTDNHIYIYSPVNGDIVSCVLTSNETCSTGSPAVSNAISMTVNPNLPVSVSIAVSANPVCANTSVTLTATPANGGATPAYQWKVNGFNAGTNNRNFSYVPVDGDIVICVLTSNETCETGSPATSNAVNMTVIPSVGTPAIPTPSTSTICQGSAGVSFSTSAPNATAFVWSVTGAGNTISGTGPTGTVTWAPGFSGIATVSVVATGCNGPSASASSTVTVRPTPVATITGTTTVCQNGVSPNITFSNPENIPVVVTYNINGANQSTISVGPNTSATVAVLTNNSGTFSYNLVGVDYQTTPTCSNTSVSGSAIVTINALPIPTLSSSDPDNVFCAGTSITFTAGGGTNFNFRVGSVSKQNGSSNIFTTTSLTNGQQVDVIVTNSALCSATSSAILNLVNPLPFYDISTPATCSPDLSTYSLAVKVFVTGISVTSSSGTVTYAGNNIWTISGVPAGTNVTVTITDGNCQSILVVTAPDCSCPAVSAPVSGGNKSYCASAAVPTISATVLTGETVDWYDSSSGGTLLRRGNLNYTPAAAGTYYALARNIITGCLSTIRTAVTVTMNALPTPTLVSSDADNSFCAGSSITFTAGGGTNFNFLVQGVSVKNGAASTYTTNSLTNNQVVSVIVTNANECTAVSAGITNTVNAIPVPNAGTGGNECDLNFNLHAIQGIGAGTWTKTSGSGTAIFTPDPNTANATVTVSEYGTYVFTWTEVRSGCSGSASITVNFYQQPIANPGTGGNNCGMESLLKAVPSVGSGTWTKTAGPGTAAFTPNANTPNAIVKVSSFGQYTFTWTEVNGTCSNSASANLNFFQVPAANAGIDGSECDLDFVLSAVTGTGSGTWAKVSGPGTATFSPDTHQPGAKVTVSQYGVYDFSWTEVSSVCQSSDIVRVTFRNVPSVSAGRDTVICKGESVQLNAVGVGSFRWDPDTLTNNPIIYNPIATPLATTSYKVTLTDQFGCKNVDTVVVNILEIPAADAGPDQELEYLLGTTMNAKLANVIETGNWSLVTGTGAISEVTNPKTSISGLSIGINKFLWTVTNRVCPGASDTVKIFVFDFVIPTLITPNNDNKNEYFVLKGLSTLGKTELIIFDRRGARVYRNPDYDNKWDGVDYNNNPLPDDTYFYVLKTQNGKSLSGFIVIRR